jgi:DNA-binding transcriptional ArsR family regulator
MDSLQDFMISRVRVQIMELFFNQPSEMYFVREITRQTHEEINAVRRELDRMLEAGILKSEERGNRLYYYVNKNYTFFPELLRMVKKIDRPWH